MINVHLDTQGKALDFNTASRMALEQAKSHDLDQPVIVSWHQRSAHAFSPSFEGADEGTWWEKYGEGNGGEMEVTVGDDYGFVMAASGGYETLQDMPLRNLRDEQGNQYTCFIPMLDDTGKPRQDACVALDDWLAKQN